MLTIFFILATFDATVRLYKQLFLLETLNTVAMAAGTSPLRITNPAFYFQDDRAFFVATLVDAAPTIGNNYFYFLFMFLFPYFTCRMPLVEQKLLTLPGHTWVHPRLLMRFMLLNPYFTG